ncbi:B12-binding domain-containing radical SAM protein [Candidatus Saganbacteria bacterium]|nr:B12-binding domain-containing radical SAM protein [Candidatus Saganbacteria bacterium]
MNILLVRPPDSLQNATLLSHTKPINLAYIAAYLLQKGFNVKIIDYEIQAFSSEAFLNILSEFKPGVIGVSCMTPTIKNGAAICELAKQHDINIKTVVGGVHANGLPVRTLDEFDSFDYLVYGEGEITFHELCLCFQDKKSVAEVTGIVYRDDRGVIVKNSPRALIKDLDILPFPARDLIDFGQQVGHSSRGFTNKIRSAEIFTSRGCPVGCTFCAIQATFGRMVRFRSPVYIEREIKECVEKYGCNHIVIADDTFTLIKEHALKICDILKRSGIKSWNCDTRVNTVSEELLTAMKDSGCQKVAFGVESGSQRIIDLIGKKITVEQVKNAVSLAKKVGIKHIEGNFIIGSDPSETLEDVAQTKKLINSLSWTFVSVTVIVPYPGTPLYDSMQAKGLLKVEEWEDFVMFGKVPKWRTENFTATELVGLQKELTKSFYLNPKYIIRQLLGIRTIKDVQYWANAGFSYIKWYLTGKV